MNYYKIRQSYNEYFKYRFLQLASKRKRFVAECKLKCLEPILSRVEDKRFICFTGSINQADILGGYNVVHSKNKDKDEVIEKFNNLDIDNLFCVNMLRESMNLRNIEVGIITQLDSKELSFIQMLGRCFRAEKPLVYVLCMRNTIDEKYLENALMYINEKYVRSEN